MGRPELAKDRLITFMEVIRDTLYLLGPKADSTTPTLRDGGSDEEMERLRSRMEHLKEQLRELNFISPFIHFYERFSRGGPSREP